MKKAFLLGGIGLGVVLVVAYVAVAFFLGGIVRTAVNQLGPKLTQSRVELAGATLSPLSGTGTLEKLSVGNPAGWSDGNAFYLGQVHLDVEPRSVFRDVVVINELTIDRPEFNYETRIVSSNIGDLLKNIEKAAGSGSAKDPAAKDGSGKKFIVKKLRLTNGKATLGVGGAALPVPLPEIELDNVGTAEGGVSGARLSVIIVGDVLKTIVRSVAEVRNVTGGDNVEKVKDAAKQLGDSVKDLFKKKGP